jgi:hypothetical protein
VKLKDENISPYNRFVWTERSKKDEAKEIFEKIKLTLPISMKKSMTCLDEVEFDNFFILD